MPARLLVILALTFITGCHTATPVSPFNPSSLGGVWEVTACEALVPLRSGGPATIPNDKYCFSAREAYPELPADSPNDSADGGGDYYIVGRDILVIRTGVPGGLHSYQLISITPEQLVWLRGDLRVTLRRVARSWNGGDAPVLKSRSVPVIYPH